MSAEARLKLKWPSRSVHTKGAFAVVEKLRQSGFAAFIAGGAVRDAVLRRPIKDIDIATSAIPTRVEKLFKKTIPTGKRHGTITVRMGNANYEVTTFRTEGNYEKYRRPSKVDFVHKAATDARRRDFTINALFYDPEASEVIDYVGGLADLRAKRIDMVGSDEKRVREDALRMLRAVRFAAVLGFDLSRETRKAILKNAKLIKKISAERIKQELDRILESPRASVGIGLLDVVGLLEIVLPELKNLKGVRQPKNQHAEGDAYAHTLLALEKFDSTYDLATRYAVLFHDLGKADTSKVRDGKITFYNHQKVGSKLAVKICRRLKFSTSDTQKIAWLVENHLVPNDFGAMRVGTRRKWGLSPHFGTLLKVYLADAKASLPSMGRQNFRPYSMGFRILKEISRKPMLKVPLVSGTDIMKVLKIKEGPLVGKVLKILEQKKLAGKIKSRSEAINFLEKNNKYLKKFSK